MSCKKLFSGGYSNISIDEDEDTDDFVIKSKIEEKKDELPGDWIEEEARRIIDQVFFR